MITLYIFEHILSLYSKATGLMKSQLLQICHKSVNQSCMFENYMTSCFGEKKKVGALSGVQL